MKVFILIAVITMTIAREVPHIDWSSVELSNQPKDASAIRDRRIHIGQPVEPHSFPYQAGILTRHQDTMVGRWGGSLITTQSVLASAHSFFSPLFETVIILGAHYITHLEDTQQRFYMDLNQIYRHPNFGQNSNSLNFKIKYFTN